MEVEAKSISTPVRIQPFDANSLGVEWRSGDRFSLSYRQMRYYCPCASCVDEWTGQRVVAWETIPADIKPVEIRAVGRYAIQVFWNDAHQTGIYHYDFLFQLCQKQGQIRDSLSPSSCEQ